MYAANNPDTAPKKCDSQDMPFQPGNIPQTKPPYKNVITNANAIDLLSRLNNPLKNKKLTNP